MKWEQAVTSIPKSKPVLLVHFFAVSCFRLYLYIYINIHLNKISILVYISGLTEGLNKNWNSACFKILVVWNTCYSYVQVSTVCL